MTTHVVALSGGKDSTALALRLLEVEPREYVYLCTPTGNELPEMVAHWARLECLLGRPIERVTNRSLGWWIEKYEALPNNRQRWCTRLLKIEPCHAFMATLTPPVTLYVGLRGDEEERTGVIYGGPVTERYPMREWGWGLADVLSYLKQRGVKVPARTDCAWCYDQRLAEWYWLWRDQPELYAQAEASEVATGHTFRSPSRDSWPASLTDLRVEFLRGRIPDRGKHRVRLQLPLIQDDDEPETRCRVCRL